jgi:thiosulfate dehydrogenase [quinone] large subunit
MTGNLTTRERGVRVALGVFLAFVALNVGLFGHNTEATVWAWGAAVLASTAFFTAATGDAGATTPLGLGADWSLALLAARLYVGWEFLYAGWLKATNGWYTNSAGTAEVKGILAGAIAQSHASAQNPFPAVPHWFAWLADNVFMSHADLIGYLVVTGELAVGIGLILGLFVRLSAFFAVVLNSLFMYAGALGAGLNPEMVVLGMVVLMGPASAVYAASADRYLIPRIRERLKRSAEPDSAVHAH